jgi:hypothetical protein
MRTRFFARTLPASTFLILLLFGSCETVSGQLFGERTLGSSLKRGNSPRQSANPGTVDSGRRFLRDQRDVTDFVGAGSAAAGAAGFVGGASAATAATSSVAGLREQIRPPLNRPRLPRNSGLYPERLSLSADLQPVPATSFNPPVYSSALLKFIQQHALTIEVSSEDHVATLRGQVPSEHDRQLIAAFVMFEPAIQSVVNDLVVDPSLPTTVRKLKRPPE